MSRKRGRTTGRATLKRMKISADFTVVPDDYAKAAASEYRVEGVPSISFPFYIDEVDPEARYLHWAFTDPDSIPVCGFEWIHWTVANLPIDALMFDFNDSPALAIPPDFSRQMPAMIPEAVQGRNSSASHFVGRNADPALTMRYNGPQPPDKDHDYCLHVWATKQPLPGLNQGFWLNELLRGLRESGENPDQGVMFVTGRA